MGKNQQASGLTNIIHYDNNGNITFVSGSTTLMSISSSGAITTTGVISGSNVLTASYANNAELLDGLDSTAFATTGAYSATSGSLYTVSSSAYATSGSLSTASGSFNTRVSALEATGSALSSSILSVSSSAYATSGSLSATSGSLSAASGSFNTRVSALEVTSSALSSSILSVSSSAYATSGSLSAASGSFNSRVASLETYSTNLTAKTASFATTGSNTFIGSQVVSGSLTASGSITATGTITAQTLVVQTITSSVVYSSGSNVFGNDIGNSQRFTGSVLITGSLTIAGASSATSYSGTTIYGSTVVCSPVGKFSTCLDLGGALTGTSATFTGNVTINAGSTNGLILQNSAGGESPNVTFFTPVNKYNIDANAIGTLRFFTENTDGSGGVVRVSLDCAGAATFSSTITGTTIYGSTAVCSAVGYFSGCVGIGTNSPQSILHAQSGANVWSFNGGCACTPYNNNSNGFYTNAGNISITSQYGTINWPEDYTTLSTTKPWWMLGNRSGTAGQWTLTLRTGYSGSGGLDREVIGVYSTGTDTARTIACIRLSTGAGVEALKIDSAGAATFSSSVTASNNVLINLGTASTASTGGTLWLTTNNNTIRAAAIQAITQLTDNAHDLLFYTNPSYGTPVERMRITSGGNVGIGTCSPNFKTHISTGDAASITQPTAGTYGLYVQQNTSGNVGGLYIQDGASNSGNSIFVGDNNGVARFVVNTDGNVLVGSSSNNFGKLDITVDPSSYTAALGLGLQTNSGEGNSVGISFKTKVSLSGVIWENARIAAFTDAISSSAYGALAFYTMNATTLSERMRIGNNGYVGIGIASPGAKLHVDGTIFSTTRSNTIDTDDGVSNNFQGYGGYWALRTDNSNRFNLDVYNSGTPITALQLSLAGESTFSKSITATGLSLSCSTGLQKIVASRLFTANTTTYYDTTINQAGMLIINSSNDRAGVFVVSAPGGGNSAISEIGDPSSYYSTTCNNANTVNFFFSGGSGNLIMQNCSGATRDFSLTHVGTP